MNEAKAEPADQSLPEPLPEDHQCTVVDPLYCLSPLLPYLSSSGIL